MPTVTKNHSYKKANQKLAKSDKKIGEIPNKLLRIALVGNPNSGKTTLFNRLTGSKQYVGNWPGVTVEKKTGHLQHNGINAEIIDLPGIYSLSPYSPEEIITRNCLLNEQIDLIINIVDATNLERNLYLSTQLMEFGLPLVVALNMIDLLEKKGHIVNNKTLSTALGLPVVPISAGKGAGIGTLLDVLFKKEHSSPKACSFASGSICKNCSNCPLFSRQTVTENNHLKLAKFNTQDKNNSSNLSKINTHHKSFSSNSLNSTNSHKISQQYLLNNAIKNKIESPVSLDFNNNSKNNLSFKCTTLTKKNIYSNEINQALQKIEAKIINNTNLKAPLRWYAIKIFEDDDVLLKELNLTKVQLKEIEFIKNTVKINEKNVDRQMLIADQRYKFICDICTKSIKKKLSHKISATEKIDRIVTNKYLALPFFLGLMLSVFFVTFGPLGNFLRDNVQFFITDVLGNFLESSLVALGASAWAKSLLIGGIVEGVGSVVSFLPQIALLFLLLCALEDSGYMARAAFITDRLLRKIGLSGKAFVPLLMGFGCSVPAILGTRILEKDKDKKLTILMIPFMSCSAKMPVYAMFITTFFTKNQPLVIFSIYFLGIIFAIITALIFKNSVLKGDSAPFILELPEYKFPTPKNLLLHVWEHVKDFLTKAGTVLLAAAVVIWFLQSFNFSLRMVANSSESILASIGSFIAPAFAPCGFGDWKSAVALLSGIIAKESVVSTMAVLYNAESSANLSAVLSQHFTPISAYAFMVFVLLYTPCVAALSAIKKELKSITWTAGIMFYQILVAWLAACGVFQLANLFSR